ncbi:hypothetical protein GP486_006129 [Trichoglossum hirsutum]|uniref:Uncharacterized protein n=1 Tax=Trichoglossum hirsutum TaxID=265104 RepID=A0A9P8RL09_9PEZI|nr:hypothetical protein GP486_006129 [Trichoglossum hirsutum]
MEGAFYTDPTNVQHFGLCHITGDFLSPVQNVNILPFETSRNGEISPAQYLRCIRAILDMESWSSELDEEFCKLRGPEHLNIGRVNNKIPISEVCRRAWDEMSFRLIVDWSSYDRQTGEFDCTFEWVDEPDQNIFNFWHDPFYTRSPAGYPMDGARIPFRQLVARAIDGRESEIPPVPSAHLIYLREIAMRTGDQLSLIRSILDESDGEADVEDNLEDEVNVEFAEPVTSEDGLDEDMEDLEEDLREVNLDEDDDEDMGEDQDEEDDVGYELVMELIRPASSHGFEEDGSNDED